MSLLTHKFYTGDVLTVLRTLPEESVNCVVTSPPYWGLRDYGVDGQIGLEETPETYVAKMVAVFREVWRVLRKDGALWLNLGDSYAHNGTGGNGATGGLDKSTLASSMPPPGTTPVKKYMPPNLKPKDLIGIPWRVAFALQADGWYLRSDIIWAKPNPMPESVTDRPTRAHEYIFLLSKSQRYFYDHEAIKEMLCESSIKRISQYNFANQKGGSKDYGNGINPSRSMRKTLENFADKQRGHSRRHAGFNDRWDGMTKEEQSENGRNKRDVWMVATRPFSEAHFATFPPALIEPCILAGCPSGGIVLDPFGGAGTASMVAAKHGRNSIYIDLNPKYREMAIRRLREEVTDQGSLFADHRIEVAG